MTTRNGGASQEAPRLRAVAENTRRQETAESETTMKNLTINQIDAKDYLEALHAAHSLMTRQLRMLENNQMHGNRPTTNIRILCEQIDAIEELGVQIEEIANG